MQNSRRKFIQTASLAFVGASLQPTALWAYPNELAATKRLIGIQLYSVRDDMDKNPLETLTALSNASSIVKAQAGVAKLNANTSVNR